VTDGGVAIITPSYQLYSGGLSPSDHREQRLLCRWLVGGGHDAAHHLYPGGLWCDGSWYDTHITWRFDIRLIEQGK